MSSAKANGNGAAPKGPKGDGKDDTIAKVTGAVIATGIAYSLYKSFAGKKKEDSICSGEFDHPKSEPFHEQINLEKPEILSDIEAEAKEKAGALKNKAGEFKVAVEDKGRELKSAIEGKGEEIKEVTAEKEEGGKDFIEEGKDKASSKVNKAKDTGSSWFRKAGFQANKDKEEAEKIKDSAKRFALDKERAVENGGSSFFDKVGDEVNREKEDVKGAVAEVEKNVGKAGAAVGSKTSELAHKVVPGGKSKPRESAWSKAGGSKAGGKREYELVRGDTLWSISRRYEVTIEELKTCNNIWDADFIIAGDTITIPK